MAIYRKPTSLTAWRLSNDNPSARGASPVNIGTEFAGYDAPKLKFLFTVSFEFGDDLRQMVDAGDTDMGKIKYACKNATRPNITTSYTEVNSYNYRRKVATRTDVGTVTLTFYDDNKNIAHTLLQQYLQGISPVAGKSAESYYTDANIQEWASLGPLPDNQADGLIRSMRVTHHYSEDYSNTYNSHAMMHYDYINPKIQSFAWDDLDMSASEASTISITFVYDSVNIIEDSPSINEVTGTVTVNNGDTDDGDAVENVRT